MKQPLADVRCRKCGKLFFRGALSGYLEIVCPARECRVWQAITLPESAAAVARLTDT